MLASLFFRLIACLLLCAAVQAHALTAEAARAMAAGDTDDRIAALQAAIATPDEATAVFAQEAYRHHKAVAFADLAVGDALGIPAASAGVTDRPDELFAALARHRAWDR